MTRTSIATALLVAHIAGWSPALAASAAAQRDSRLERAMAALPAAAARDLERMVKEARSRGLPTTPLVDKALEGTAKGVPGDRVVEVVRRLADDLGRAHELIARNGRASPADVTAVADALRRGVPGEAVRSLRADAAANEPLALAVHTLADLLDRGVPVDNALDVLGAWRSGGANPEELRALPAAVERMIREGALPAQAAAAVASAVREGGAAGRAGGAPGQATPADAKGKSKDKGKGKPPGKGKGNGPPDRPPFPPGTTPPGSANGKKSGGG